MQGALKTVDLRFLANFFRNNGSFTGHSTGTLQRLDDAAGQCSLIKLNAAPLNIVQFSLQWTKTRFNQTIFFP